ncbi:MAG TPA: CoA ester lyase [Hyphomicrobiaceae bacterium]|nr:CoA ester lyase [Hyphomicrobiaceae bacterium]
MRSKLFVPADSVASLEQVLTTCADAVCLDLEDTVRISRKAEARARLSGLLARPNAFGKSIIVRINGCEAGLLADDLDVAVAPGTHVINLPKPESPARIREIAARVQDLERQRGIASPIGLLINIETPSALRQAAELALASPRICGLQIGYADLLEPHGIDRFSAAALDGIRLAVKLAASEANVAAYDGVFAFLDMPDAFAEEARGARRLGFAGKSCFDEAQAALANLIFQPQEQEVARARRIVDAAETAFRDGKGLFVLDGRMVDEPFVQGARRLLDQARQAQQRG